MKHHKSIQHPIISIVVFLFFVLFMFPFGMVILNSAKTSKEIINNAMGMPESWGQLFANVKAIFTNESVNYISAFFDSSAITIITLAVIVIFSSMCAWVLVRNDSRISRIVFMLFVMVMVIPFQVVMLPILTVFRNIGNFTGIQMLSSYKGVIFAYLGFGGSMSIFVLHGFIKGIPRELEEAAWIDGCSPEGTFFRIIMPLLRPVQMTVLILNGLWIWNDYLLPSIMLGLNGKIKTLPIAVSSFVGSYVKQWDLILSAAFLAMIPIVILFLIAQKQIIQGMVDGAIK